MFEIIVIIAVILLIIYFLKNKNTYNKKRKYVKKPQIKNITKTKVPGCVETQNIKEIIV